MIVADSAQIDRLAAIDGVATIENFAPRIKHNEFGGGAIMGSALANASGFDGSTQTIAIADTGLGSGTAAERACRHSPRRAISSIFNWPGVADFCFETIVNDGAQDVDSGHGTHVATAALGAGNASGAGRGTAPARSLVFQAIENYAVPSLLCSLVYGIARRLLPGRASRTTSVTSSTRRISRTRACIRIRGAPKSPARIRPTAPMPMRSSGRIAISPSRSRPAIRASTATATASSTACRSTRRHREERDHRRRERERSPVALGVRSVARPIPRAPRKAGRTRSSPTARPGRIAIRSNPLRDDPSAGNAEQMAAFSSRGPDQRWPHQARCRRARHVECCRDTRTLFQQQYDGRRTRERRCINTTAGDFRPNASYKYMGGTSMAAPLVAGGAAVVRDFYQKSTGPPGQRGAGQGGADQLRRRSARREQRRRARQRESDSEHPRRMGPRRSRQRHRRQRSCSSTKPPRCRRARRASHTLRGHVAGRAAQGDAGVDRLSRHRRRPPPRLVNDLDLTVTAPDGTIYMGNVFSRRLVGCRRRRPIVSTTSRTSTCSPPRPAPGRSTSAATTCRTARSRSRW